MYELAYAQNPRAYVDDIPNHCIAIIAINELFYMPSETNAEDRAEFKERVAELIHKGYDFLTSEKTYLTLPPYLKRITKILKRGDDVPQGRVCFLGGAILLEAYWPFIQEIYLTFLVNSYTIEGGLFREPTILQSLKKAREQISKEKYGLHVIDGKIFHLSHTVVYEKQF